MVASRRVFYHNENIKMTDLKQEIKEKIGKKQFYDYGEGIKTLRLENGKPIELIENNTEEDYILSASKNGPED